MSEFVVTFEDFVVDDEGVLTDAELDDPVPVAVVRKTT
jgi:hypothetical protein